MRSRVLFSFVAAFALMAVPGYATTIPELSFTLSEAFYPPGLPAICEVTGTAPCVQIFGTLTDNDTDGSALALAGISVDFTGSDADFFSLDQNVFFNDTGVLEGDTLNNFASNTYTGPIFGIDIAPSVPPGIYTETAVITACNLTNDPDCESGNPDPGAFTVSAQFQIDVAPEPAAGSLALVGFTALLAGYGLRRKWRPSEALLR